MIGSAICPRVSVFRSNKFIYVSLIDNIVFGLFIVAKWQINNRMLF